MAREHFDTAPPPRRISKPFMPTHYLACDLGADSGRVILGTLANGKILLEGDPKTLPGEHGKRTLEELFIAVSREPLTLERN